MLQITFGVLYLKEFVKEYVKKSHNGKGIKATFPHVEAIREYLKSVKIKKETSLGRVVSMVSPIKTDDIN